MLLLSVSPEVIIVACYLILAAAHAAKYLR